MQYIFKCQTNLAHRLLRTNTSSFRVGYSRLSGSWVYKRSWVYKANLFERGSKSIGLKSEIGVQSLTAT